MSMKGRFNVGDRVRVTEVDESDWCAVGQIGTVLEDSGSPWVAYDTRCPNTPRCMQPTVVGERIELISESQTMLTCRLGYIDCVPDDCLELVEQETRQ